MASFLLMLAAAASMVTGCEIPTEELPNSIAEEFAIQVQNPAFPEIHNRLYNIWSSGGGDQHPFLSPAGNSTDELTLVDGVITMATVVPTIRAVINGEVSPAARQQQKEQQTNKSSKALTDTTNQMT